VKTRKGEVGTYVIHRAGDEYSRRDAMQLKVGRDRLRVFFPLRPGVFLRVSDDLPGPASPPSFHLCVWG
jgi:hypothetical protein